MDLLVLFLTANHFRLRLRRTRDIRYLRTWELYHLYTLMLFGDGTHSKGDLNPTHLTFTQKSKCGGGWWESQVPYTPKTILLKKRETMMLALPCYKKLWKKDEIKKKKEREGGFSYPKAFAYHHNQATAATVSQLPSTHAAGKYTKVRKGNKCSLTLLTHVISIKIKLDHANSYFLCLCSMVWFGCIHEYIHRLFKLSIVIRLK
jgi:hypothetical protein